MMKRNLVYLFLVITSIGLMGSCSSNKAAVATFSDLDGEWKVVELNGQSKDPAETRQTIKFDTLRKLVSGHAGCNRMTGSVEYNDNQKHIIKLSKMATTRMACLDMTGESEYLDVLGKVVRFEAVGDIKPVTEVAFYAADNSKILVIKK